MTVGLSDEMKYTRITQNNFYKQSTLTDYMIRLFLRLTHTVFAGSPFFKADLSYVNDGLQVTQCRAVKTQR